MSASSAESQPIVVADPHRLIESGEPVADIPALAELLGVSRSVLRILVDVFYFEIPFIDRKPRLARLYSVAAMRVVVDRERPKIEARRLAHEARTAAEVEAARIKRQAKKGTEAVAPPPSLRPERAHPPKVADPASQRPTMPEVFTIRRARP